MRTHRTTNFRATAVTVSIVLAALGTVATMHRAPLTWLMVGVDVAVCVLLFTDWLVSTRAKNRRAEVPVVSVRPVLRVVREASDYDWPTNADDDWFARLYDDRGELR